MELKIRLVWQRREGLVNLKLYPEGCTPSLLSFPHFSWFSFDCCSSSSAVDQRHLAPVSTLSSSSSCVLTTADNEKDCEGSKIAAETAVANEATTKEGKEQLVEEQPRIDSERGKENLGESDLNLRAS